MLERFVFNVEGMSRREKLEGREYVVVPAVMLKEGVINGSKGPLFYPREELSKTPAVWNHKPVVVNHPMFNGEGISACDPKVIEGSKIGMLLNTRWDEEKLKTEVWLDEEKAKKVEHGQTILDNVAKGVKTEVSTGLFTDNEESAGEYNNVPYGGIARNHRPDHLAVLTHTKGALSIEMGGGLLVNELKGMDLVKAMRSHKSAGLSTAQLTINGLSYGDIHRQLCQSLDMEASKGGSPSLSWVEDVYDSFYVYQNYQENRYYKDDYTIGKDLQVKTSGKPEEVRKHSEYRTTDGKTVAPRKVDLTAGGSGGSGMGILNEGNPVATETTQTPPAAPPAQPAPPAVPAPAAPVFNNLGDFVQKGIPQEFQTEIQQGLFLLNQQRELQKQEKEHYVAAILVNSSNLFTKEQLQGMDLGVLKSIGAMANVLPMGATPPPATPNYAGAGTPPPVNNTYNPAGQVQPQHLVMPTMNWDKK